MRKHLIIFVVLCCSVIAGCASLPGSDAVLLDVPFCVQETDHCGCACLEMVMRYHGLSPDRGKIEEAVHVPALGGSTAGLIVEAARNAGLETQITEGSFDDLRSWLTAKTPPILFLKHAENDAKGHFVVVTGITKCGKHVRVHSGKQANRWMDREDLGRRWETGRFKALPVGVVYNEESAVREGD